MPEGVHTAGTSSQISDGAAAVLLMTKEKADELGVKPMATIVDSCLVGSDPVLMLTGPIYATQKLLDDNGLTMDDIDVVEINEAFAAQVLACKKLIGRKHVEIPDEKLNVNGGSVALGHPVGASGARLILTLSKELKRRNLTRGVASLCVGGGQGAAIHIETCK